MNDVMEFIYLFYIFLTDVMQFSALDLEQVSVECRKTKTKVIT